jgi:hypothetical protein
MMLSLSLFNKVLRLSVRCKIGTNVVTVDC